VLLKQGETALSKQKPRTPLPWKSLQLEQGETAPDFVGHNHNFAVDQQDKFGLGGQLPGRSLQQGAGPEEGDLHYNLKGIK
jgi:hypothetical protein